MEVEVSIPTFADGRHFWLRYAEAHPRRHGEWMVNKLSANAAGARQSNATWTTVRDLAGYCLSFFDVLENPA